MLVTETRESAPISNTAPVRIEDWNEASTAFEAITGYYTEDVSETSGDLPEKFRLARVAPRFLDVWGVAPAFGRGFTPQESQEGAASVVVISYRFWQTQLQGDPNVLERQLRLGNEGFSIVGVMPASFPFPDRDVDLWAPRIYLPWMLNDDARNYLWYSGYGRLKPGVSLEEARADLAVVQARLAEQYPETDRDVGVHLEPLKQTTVGGVSGSLWLLFGSVSVLLLIAATNVAGLLVSRAVERRQEFAVRFSLGAPRWSVIVQALTETGVLAIAGASSARTRTRWGAAVRSRRSSRVEIAPMGASCSLRRDRRRRHDSLRVAAGDPERARRLERGNPGCASHAGVGAPFAAMALRRRSSRVVRRAPRRSGTLDPQFPRALARRSRLRAPRRLELPRERLL
jgi:hypothetical protein